MMAKIRPSGLIEEGNAFQIIELGLHGAPANDLRCHEPALVLALAERQRNLENQLDLAANVQPDEQAYELKASRTSLRIQFGLWFSTWALPLARVAPGRIFRQLGWK